MIEAKKIHVEVNGKTLLHDVSVSFSPGKLHLIMGPNGAGKSTLIHVLSKLRTPNSGHVLFSGTDLNAFTDRELSRTRAVLSQNVDLAFPLTVVEVVMMGRYPHFGEAPGSRDQQAVEEAMRSFDVTPFRNRNYMSLSGGEKQRVQFARVLAQIWFAQPNGCRYLLLDEPLTFLDIYHQLQFMNKIRELLTPDLVIVGVLHDLNLAARFADHLVLLKDGQVLAQGTRDEVLTVANIKEAYQVEPHFVQHNGSPVICF